MSNIFKKFAEIRPDVWLVVGILVLISIIGGVVLDTKKRKLSKTKVNQTRKIVYGGMCIALSFVLSYIRLYRMPQGGSITPGSMLPLILYSIIFGPAAGITAGVGYGFLQFFQDGGIVHWAQLLLDYPLAFGFLGIAGLVPQGLNMRTRIIIGTVIAVIGRGIMHVLSGAIFFASYAGDKNPWIHSATYNFSFLTIEAILVIVIAVSLSYTSVYDSINEI